mgnify:CR=1 FL=1
MSVKVYAWPPVGVVGGEWSEVAPVEISRSPLTGREFVSAAQRRRRVAALNVSALSRGRSGAGYMEMLKRLLGGVHLVRLTSTPINWHLDHQAEASWRQSFRLYWEAGGDDLAWQMGGSALYWYTGAYLTGTAATDGPWPAVLVSGLPPRAKVARPGEFIDAFLGESDVSGARAQVLREAFSNDHGQALIRLYEPLPGWVDGARVNLGTSNSAVFRPLEYPRAIQPLGEDWNYSWTFREVFADEVGGFDEIDPWT